MLFRFKPVPKKNKGCVVSFASLMIIDLFCFRPSDKDVYFEDFADR
jgi:hypothetical protein